MDEKADLKIHGDRIKLGELAVELMEGDNVNPFVNYSSFKKIVMDEIGTQNYFYDKVKYSSSIYNFDKIISRFDDRDNFILSFQKEHKYEPNPNLADNRILLKEILRSARISKRECSELLWRHHNSLDGYLLKFSGKSFPQSFAYFFLNSIFFHTEISLKAKKERAYEDPQKFEDIIRDAMDIGVEEKLILPALEYHMQMIVKASMATPQRTQKKLKTELTLKEEELNEIKKILNKGEKITLFEIDKLINKYKEHKIFWFYAEKNPLIKSIGFTEESVGLTKKNFSASEIDYKEEYLNAILNKEEYLNTKRRENHLLNLQDDEFKDSTDAQFEKLSFSIKNFKIFLETMRKIHLENFMIPSEITNISSREDSGIVFTKKFLNTHKLKDKELVLHKIEGIADGEFNKDDIVLIQKFSSIYEPHPKDFTGGIYALKRGERIFVRKLDCIGSTINIYSENNQKPPLQMDFLTFLKEGWLYGKVQWSISNHSNINYEIPTFLKNNTDLTKKWEDIYEEVPQERSKKIA